MNLLHLKNVPIFEQLKLEEALLRLNEDNIVIINEGSTPAIVMGISGKPNELIHQENHAQNPIPIIKRFSGGGTVIVDEDTIFISFLSQKSAHNFAPYPEPIMRWTEEIYKDALNHPEFALRENDYVIGAKKFGGNAQYLRKDRWLHHSTFLWNYKKEHMDLLLHPKKTPKYRDGRNHSEFLTKLSNHLLSKDHFIESFKLALKSRFEVQEITLEDVMHFVKKPHRKSTTTLTPVC